ncbi:sensor histidine kinase [Rhizorhabdus argentea]|uniref:sensor histidine kinase n=1 Tax=Rhizorhabdus argentea TaxID=1387174 RepID=UPI0030ECDB5F
MSIYACALAMCLLSFLVRWLATPLMPSGYPFVSFFPAVILSTFLFGVRAGALAGIISGVAGWYCFIPPSFSVKWSGAVAFALVFYTGVAAINIVMIHWLQCINERLAEERERNRRLAERGELLFRELQHRVSNNLQVISGLLSLQMRGVSDAAARLALDEASRRLALIGRIHRQLYSPHGQELRLAAFLEQLGADLIDASGRFGIDYRVEAVDDVALAADAAVPMALIIAEAVTNAIEHGFPAGEGGHILIRVTRVDGAVEISVSDDGAGLPADFDLAKSDSLGLKLAQMLARQMGGSFRLTGGDGTAAVLRIP